MNKAYGLGVALAMSCSTAALAQTADGTYTTDGPYLGIGGGASFMRDNSPRGNALNLNTSYKDGWTGVGEVGYGFGTGLRLELQGGYLYNELDHVHRSSVTQGKVELWTAFLNGIYDIDTTAYGIDNYGFVPHLGVGVGYANVHAANAQFFNGNTVSGSDDVFAYQGIAGLDYAITPDIKIGLDYHFLGTDLAEFNSSPSGIHGRASFQTHEALLNLRYELNTPPPAPVPVSVPPPPVSPPPRPVARAPEAQRSFQVFFDFDKSNITAAAGRVIEQAAASVRQGNGARIMVTGHTDTVGSAAYNQALSERRATAVKQQLIADGVGGDDITTTGVGKTGLLVPTADGVREPQNRRAEIVLQSPGM